MSDKLKIIDVERDFTPAERAELDRMLAECLTARHFENFLDEPDDADEG